MSRPRFPPHIEEIPRFEFGGIPSYDPPPYDYELYSDLRHESQPLPQYDPVPQARSSSWFGRNGLGSTACDVDEPPVNDVDALPERDIVGLEPKIHDMNESILGSWWACVAKNTPEFTLDTAQRMFKKQEATGHPWLVLTLPIPTKPRSAMFSGTRSWIVNNGRYSNRKVVGSARIEPLRDLGGVSCANALSLTLTFASWAQGFGFEKVLIEAILTRLSEIAANGGYTSGAFWGRCPPTNIRRGTPVIAETRSCRCRCHSRLFGLECKSDRKTRKKWEYWGFAKYAQTKSLDQDPRDIVYWIRHIQ